MGSLQERAKSMQRISIEADEMFICEIKGHGVVIAEIVIYPQSITYSPINGAEVTLQSFLFEKPLVKKPGDDGSLRDSSNLLENPDE